MPTTTVDVGRFLADHVVVNIMVLPDHVLLEIFDFYKDDPASAAATWRWKTPINWGSDESLGSNGKSEVCMQQSKSNIDRFGLCTDGKLPANDRPNNHRPARCSLSKLL